MVLANKSIILKNSENERTTKGSLVFYLFFLVILVGIDEILKQVVFLLKISKVFFGFIGIVNFKNYNFAFSLYLPAWLMFAIYAVALILIANYLLKNFDKLGKTMVLAWGLILAGAIANIGERVILGYVRDFIYIFSGIFNIADGYIILGVLLILFNQKKVKNQGLASS